VSTEKSQSARLELLLDEDYSKLFEYHPGGGSHIRRDGFQVNPKFFWMKHRGSFSSVCSRSSI
jgi:hypothetical protein